MSASSPTHSPTVAAPPLPMLSDVQLAPGSTAKLRSPLAVAVFSLITLGVYAIFWHYYVNREMADYGRARGTNELGDNPTLSALALFPGALLVVPAVWTLVTTFQRLQAAQRLTRQAPLSGWLGLLLYLVIFPAYFAYLQSGLNAAWRASAGAVEPKAEPLAG
jgi:hypothetical protein